MSGERPPHYGQERDRNCLRYNDILSLEKRRKWNEYGWPILSHLMYLRLFHYRHIGKKANIQSGQNVLEIGSGYPAWKWYSHRVGEEGTFIALDINENIQRRSKKMGDTLDRLFRRRYRRDQVVVGDANNLPFTDNSFDTVIMANYTGNKDYVFDEVHRVLRPGGRLVRAHVEPFGYTRGAMNSANYLYEFGFESVQISGGSAAGLLPGVVRNIYIEARKPV
jgi:SAM-dependent methyltransferase